MQFEDDMLVLGSCQVESDHLPESGQSGSRVSRG